MILSAFTKYDRLAASTRQRLLQYLPAFGAAGIEVRYQPLLGNDYVRSLASGQSYSRVRVATAYLRRMQDIARASSADVIWVYAELFPYLPASFERLIFAAGKPVVYDFDDAFFHNYDRSHPALQRLLKNKLEPLLRGAAACCCGNAYLADYARRFCDDSIILPTVVDTNTYRERTHAPAAGDPLTVGWIGSPSTWGFMRPLLPMLSELARSCGIRVRVVGAGAAAEAERFPGLDLVEWTEDSEVADVQAMDIGLMPLGDDKWTRGKSGYKLVQYMACGLPVIASPVGVNADIVEHGVNGYLANDEGQWRSALVRLIDNPELREQMGAAGRRRAVERYSLAANAPRLVDLLRRLHGS